MSKKLHQSETPDTATDKPKLAAIPAEDQPRSGNELKTIVEEKEMLKQVPVCRRTWYNWRKDGKIPYIKIGRRCLYHLPSVLEALLRLQRGGNL